MIRIGKIVATHGLGGALVMTHVIGNSKWLKKKHILHIEMQKGSFIPYFVINIKANSDREYVVNLEDVGRIEEAKKLVTKQVYVDEAILADYAKHTPLLWIGFELADKSIGTIGKVEDVMQSGPQWVARIMYKGHEALVPLVDGFIEKVDVKTKTIHAVLPDGLLDIYTDTK